MKKNVRNSVKISKIFMLVTFLFFVVIIFRTAQLATSDTIDGHDLSTIADQRTTRTDILPATRGTIYTSDGEVLAQNVASYTLIAYLDESRSDGSTSPKHVVDKELTAKELSAVIGMPESEILNLLSKDNVYQTEFGAYGRDLTELTKEKIVDLNLPGLDFIEEQKRYYPNGNFASYTVGYSRNVEIVEDDVYTEEIVGELGIEKEFNDILKGTDGYITYQKDLKGYQIPGTEVTQVDPVYGQDVYLTIDNSIQFFVEQAMKDSYDTYGYEWMTMMVAEADSGKILASGSYPAFDPNVRDLTNYLDYNVSLPYEPGSTMKIYTYMAAMETGLYDGNQTYLSGTYETSDKTLIGDWNTDGWGYITYDKGFAYSSNVAAINLVEEYMSGDILYNYFQKLGFGSTTGISLPNELEGDISFQYETEIYNAAFGQGITTTPVQNIQALTAIANDGILLEPYIIEKIIDPNTGEIEFVGERQEIERVASIETIDAVKKLMYDTVNVAGNTGTLYKLDGYDVIAKTGTAQIATEDGSGYISGKDEVIVSFAGMYPLEEPEIIIYLSVKRPGNASQKAASTVVTSVIENISKYYGKDYNNNGAVVKEEMSVENYVNSPLVDVYDEFDLTKFNVVVIGNGDTVIEQSIPSGSVMQLNEIIFLKTNSSQVMLPNFGGYSYKDVLTYCEMASINCSFSGSGYVISQSLSESIVIDSFSGTESIEFVLEPKF